jgi:hypothetical protein
MYVDSLPINDGSARDRVTVDSNRLSAQPTWDRTEGSDQPKKIALDPKNLTDVGIAEPRSVFGDGHQHRLKVRQRTAD